MKRIITSVMLMASMLLPTVPVLANDFTVTNVAYQVPLGTTNENQRDFLITFSQPAINVRIFIFEDQTGDIVSEVSYREDLISSNQSNFAILIGDLKPNTKYKWRVKGVSRADMTQGASKEGSFMTADFTTVDSFKLTDLRIEKPSLGAFLDVYVSFNQPAKNVRQIVKDMNDTVISDYYYRADLYQQGQKSFALGTPTLKSLTQYAITVSGESIATGEKVSLSRLVTTPDWGTNNYLKVVSVKITPPKFSDGTVQEGSRDFLITFDKPAKDVRLTVNPSGDVSKTQTVEYKESLIQTGQTTFALTVGNILPGTKYDYLIQAEPQIGTVDTHLMYTGSFTTDPKVTEGFALTQFRIDKLDALGQYSEAVRSFNLEFSLAPDEFTITYYKDGAYYDSYTVKVNEGVKAHYVSPGGFKKKLEPGTRYTYSIVAYRENKTKKLVKEGVIETLGYKDDDVDDDGVKDQYEDSANKLENRQIDALLAEIQTLRDQLKEQQAELKYLKKIVFNLDEISASTREKLNAFIAYGVDDNTKKLGEGERAAVINSYKQAFDKLPESEAEITDAIKIANGRFPGKRVLAKELIAKRQFFKIYKRVPNMDDPKDSAAVTVMTYGLRQAAKNRNLNSEKAGIKIFEGIYGKTPSSTEEWNIMQAITYSGATRKPDTDKDTLSDADEVIIGTDATNPDTDGDGYTDGNEILNGYNPLAQ